MTGNDLFNFTRGAIRGNYGREDFRKLKFLVIGYNPLGIALISALCMDGVDIKFYENSLIGYKDYMLVCPGIEFYKSQDVDVIINLRENSVTMGNKSFPIDKIEESDPYTQGIHAFYL